MKKISCPRADTKILYSEPYMNLISNAKTFQEINGKHSQILEIFVQKQI